MPEALFAERLGQILLFFSEKIRKKACHTCKSMIYYIQKGGEKMKRQKKKPTTIEIAELVVEALGAIAALITAFRWW